MIRGSMVYIGSPKSMKRGLGKIVKESLQEAGALWHRRDFPKHFGPAAAGRYRFEKRSDAYRKRKRRFRSHDYPLEFKGDLKRQATRMAQISGTSKRVTVKLSVPWYVAASRRRPGMPDMAKEMTQATDSEVRRLARVVEASATRKLDQIQTRETRA
jgi:hypothetical protein